MNQARPIYQLGHATFSLTHDDPDFESVLKRLFPLCSDQSLALERVIDVQMGLSLNIGECIREMINQHPACLLIQAACVVPSTNQRVMISGAPSSGKTALTLALAFVRGWKVVAEDIVIIDTEKNEIVKFGAPFNLKRGTRELLSSEGIEIPGFILRDWYPLSADMLGTDSEATIGLAVHLDEINSGSIACSRLSISEYMRKLLPISNLLSVHGTQKFLNCLPENSCYLITGGTLAERLQKVCDLCTSHDS